MAFDNVNLPLNNSSDANFQAWAGYLDGRFAACGWVLAGDTGQTNPATAPRPTATSQIVAMRIWRMNDALQATAPVFVKLEYGASSQNATAPGVWITAGTATDGAGKLTGRVTGRLPVQLYNSPTGGSPTVPGLYQCLFTGAPNRFAFLLGNNADNHLYSCWFGIERRHDASGADLPDEVHMVRVGYGTTRVTVMPTTMNGRASEENSFGCTCPQSSGVVDSNGIHFYPIRCYNSGERSPIRNFVGYLKSSVTSGLHIPNGSMYGQTQAFFTGGVPEGPKAYSSMSYPDGVAIRAD